MDYSRTKKDQEGSAWPTMRYFVSSFWLLHEINLWWVVADGGRTRKWLRMWNCLIKTWRNNFVIHSHSFARERSRRGVVMQMQVPQLHYSLLRVSSRNFVGWELTWNSVYSHVLAWLGIINVAKNGVNFWRWIIILFAERCFFVCFPLSYLLRSFIAAFLSV